MAGHSVIADFRIKPAVFGQSNADEYVDHCVAVVKRVSRSLPEALARLLEFSFAVVPLNPDQSQPMVGVSYPSPNGPRPSVEFAVSGYAMVMGIIGQVEDLPDVEEFARKLGEFTVRALDDYLEMMSLMKTVMSLTVLDSGAPEVE